MSASPSIVILAGPNGAGKSTLAPLLLRDTLNLPMFVNADTIAQGLAGFDPLGAALEAGRIMLARLHELAGDGLDFAFETTLASRTYAPWLRELKADGWSVHLFFLWLDNPDLAVQRVATRVKMGGHAVLEETVRRRYAAGLRNFAELYQPIASTWRVYDNSLGLAPQLIAQGAARVRSTVLDQDKWCEFHKACK